MRIILAIAALGAVAASNPPKKDVVVNGKKVDARIDQKDPVTCKRYPVTGSLAETRKVCMAASEWRQARDDAQAMQGNHTTTCTSPGGCTE